MGKVDFTEVKWPAKATQPVNGEAGIGTGNPGSRFYLACPGEAMLITPSNSGHLSPNCTGGMSCLDTYNSLFFTGIPFLWCHPSTLPISTLQPEGAFKSASWGTFLMVQWLRLCVATARGTGSIPGWGTKDPPWYLVQPKKKSASQWPCPPIALRTYSEHSGDFQNLMWSASAGLGSLWFHSGSCSQKPLTGALFLPHLVTSHLCPSPENRSCPGSWLIHTSPMPMNLLCIPSLVFLLRSWIICSIVCLTPPLGVLMGISKSARPILHPSLSSKPTLLTSFPFHDENSILADAQVIFGLWLPSLPISNPIGSTLKIYPGTSLVVQWLRLCAPNAGGLGFNPWSWT